MLLTTRRRIALWLYPEITKERIVDRRDPKDLMREELGGINTLVNGNYLSELSETEIDAVNRWAFELATSRWWGYLTAWAINSQSATTIGNIMHSERMAIFGCGVIDGILLLRDEVDRRKSEYELSRKKDEDFDPYQLIQN